MCRPRRWILPIVVLALLLSVSSARQDDALKDRPTLSPRSLLETGMGVVEHLILQESPHSQLRYMQRFMATFLRLIGDDDALVEHVRKNGARFLALIASPDALRDLCALSPMLSPFQDAIVDAAQAFVPWKQSLRVLPLRFTEKRIVAWMAANPDDLRQRVVESAKTIMKQVEKAPLSKVLGLDILQESLHDRMSSQAREAIQFGIPWYFDNVHRDRKRRILVAFLETDVSASVSERCLAVLQACGPGMHKVLQALAELIVHPELAEAVQQLNSHIKPMSPEQSHRLVADAFGGPDVLSRFLPDFDPVAFAGGSAAQVHRANRIDPKTGVKTPVVVKVQREGLAEAFDQDIAIFDQIAQKFPNERQFFASMQADWKSETNMVDEVVNMMVAAELYEDAEYAGVRVARVLGALPEDNPKVVVLERARGVCMDDFLAHLDQADPVAVQTAADLLVQVYSVWLKVVMFGARKFFHGDLHAGNLFFSYDARDPSKSTMTIIDFGMSGVVDEDTFQTMVRLMVGAKSQVLHHMLVALGRGTQTQVRPSTWVMLEGQLLDMFEQQKVADEASSGYRRGSMFEPRLGRRFLEILEYHSNAIRYPPALLSLIKAKLALQSVFDRFHSAIDKHRIECRLPTPGQISAKVTARPATIRAVYRTGISPLMSTAHLSLRRAKDSLKQSVVEFVAEL